MTATHLDSTPVKPRAQVDIGYSPDALLNTEQVADALQLSRRTIEVWRLKGGGPKFIRAGGRRVLYRWSAISEWLDGRTFNSTSEDNVA